MSNLAEQKQRRYTYADYLTWSGEKRYELIDGIAYMMAAPSTTHQRISKKLFRQLDNFLTGKTCEVFYAPLAVRLNADSYDDIVVEPDLFVVCDESKIENNNIQGAPDLIIEILSPSNTKHDTVRKFRQYQRTGVKEYWIVDPTIKTVQVYILKNGKYGVGSIYRDDDIVPVHTLKGCEINLADVFYDTIELDLDLDDIKSIETRIKRKVAEALKESNMSDSQIEKIINSIDN